MAVFTKSTITDKGKELIAEAVAGRTNITLTKIETSDFIYSDTTNLTKLTNINTVKQTTQVSAVNRDRGKVTVVAVLTNEHIRTGYKINCIGIYARGNNGNEILFAVLKTNDGDMIAPKSGNVATTITLDFVFTISEEANVQVVLNTSALVTTGMLDSYVKKSWGFLGQPADNLNVVLTDKTNIWGSQSYKAYTHRGEFKGELRFDNNNLYTNYVNTNDNRQKSLKRVITENDVYLDEFNTTNKRLIQTNLATGVTYVSKELSFYGKDDSNNYYALENRIGVDSKNNKFRVKQNDKWSPLITGDDLATADVAGVITENRVKELVPYGTVDETSLEGSKIKELMGCEYGGLLNVRGVKRVGVAYYDTVNKQMVVPKVENNLTYYDALKFLPISDYQTANRLENLYDFKALKITIPGWDLQLYKFGKICILNCHSQNATPIRGRNSNVLPSWATPNADYASCATGDAESLHSEIYINSSRDFWWYNTREVHNNTAFTGQIIYICN